MELGIRRYPGSNPRTVGEMNKDERHANFQKRLRKSIIVVKRVGQWMEQFGQVDIPITHVSPSPEEAHNYRDKGDIYLTKHGIKYRYEVKGMGFKFTNEHDFKYKEVAVCAVNAWNKSVRDPIAPAGFIVVSNDLFHICQIDVEATFSHWFSKWMIDRERDDGYWCIVCPLDKVEFTKMINHKTPETT